MKRKIIGLLVVALFMLVTIAGCTQAPASEAPASAPASEAQAPASEPAQAPASEPAQAPASEPASAPASEPASAAPASAAPAVDMSGAKIKISFAHGFPEKDPRGATYKWFAEEVFKRTNGEVGIMVAPSESLVKNNEAFRAMMTGSCDMEALSSTFASTEAKEFAPLDIPGALDPEKLRATHEAIKPVLEKIFAKYKMHYLYTSDEGRTTFYVSKKKAITVKKPEDLKGLIIRDHGVWVGKSIKAWGGSPMTVPPSDVSVAFERGTVDAGYTGWPFVNAFKLYESAPNVTMVGFQNMFSMIAITDTAWNKLSPEQQKIVQEVGEESIEYNIDLTKKNYAMFEKNVADAGGSIYIMTDEEKAVFNDLLEPVRKEAEAAGGDLSKELAEALKSVK